MARRNGRSEGEEVALDAGHELPASQGGAGAEVTEPSEPPRASIQSELQLLKAERDSLLDRLARSQAEFENARKRAAREQQENRDYALADAVKTLLPVLDSLERALQVASPQAADFRSGVDLIYKQFMDALSKLGVEPITALGQPFDPHQHQAIEMVETDAAPDHHVFEELQRGYKLKGRLLRPAMVRVASNSGS
jgi:molecular chaperone GrpE